MIMQYLMNIYDYIISLISLSSSRSTIKHKNSEDISDDDVEETTLLKPSQNVKETRSKIPIPLSRSKIPIPLSRSKTHVPFEKYPIYQCGYCYKSIQLPQYLFQDMVFCSIMCRTHHISVVQNTKQNTCV